MILLRNALLIAILVLSFACAKRGAQSQPRTVVATVGGQPIYDDEISQPIQTELSELQRQEYQLKMKALDHAIEQKLLATEAEKRNTTVDSLLQFEADAKVGVP